MGKSSGNPVALYAVHRGRQPGVYDSWAGCELNTKDFQGAVFRKFHSLEEAEAFVMHGSVQLASNQVPVVSSAHPGKMDLRSRKPYDKPIAATAPAPALPGEAVEIVVYTDGAAKNNQGGFGVIKRAGVGVWWADGDPRNIAERCPGDESGQTNNRAELIAIARALETTLYIESPLVIKTDSQYSINCFTQYIHGWVRNGWKKADRTDVKNVWLIRYIWALLNEREALGRSVRLDYVKGHSGIVGNEGADRMANQGCLLPEEPERDWAAEEAVVQVRMAQRTAEASGQRTIPLAQTSVSGSTAPRGTMLRPANPRSSDTTSNAAAGYASAAPTAHATPSKDSNLSSSISGASRRAASGFSGAAPSTPSTRTRMAPVTPVTPISRTASTPGSPSTPRGLATRSYVVIAPQPWELEYADELFLSAEELREMEARGWE